MELLVVVAILSLLASLLAPSLRSAGRLTRQAQCHANNRTTMQALAAYGATYGDALPFGRRSWPWMGMLDVYEEFLRPHLGGLEALHCPADPYAPGGTAEWWRGWYGRPIGLDDHVALPAGHPPESDYSYYVYVKMYWDVGEDGILNGHALRSWKRVDVRYPAQLIVQRCWWSHAQPDGAWGIQSAFIDGHAEWVHVDRIHKAAAYGDYNLDWTWWGIRGKDID